MRIEEIDDLGIEQRRVGRQREVDPLARFIAPALGVIDDLADQRNVGERLAAEEHDADAVALRRLREQQIDAARGDFEAHALAPRGNGKVFLVAVGAAQIAAGVDVQHDGAEWIALDIHAPWIDRARKPVALKHFELSEAVDEIPHLPRRRIALPGPR